MPTSLRALAFVGIPVVVLLWPQIGWCQGGSQPEATSTSALVEPISPIENISSIDKSLLLELIKLARFNIRFHQQANRHQKWRTLTYAAGREAGTAVSFAASLVDLKQRVRGLDDPSLISRNALKNVVTATLVGSAISGSASSLELAQNTWVMLQAGKNGYSPKASTAFVKNILAITDHLFEQRELLVSTLPQDLQQRHIYELESDLLHHIRQQLIIEFCSWSCHSRGQAWRENTFYSLDALQNFTRMSAAIIGLKGFGQPSLGGAAAVTTVVANSVATVSPLIGGVVGLSMRKYQQRKLAREFVVERPILATKALAELKVKLVERENEGDAKLLEEAVSLGDKSQRLDLAIDRENKDIERLRQVAQQQIVAGPIIGLTSIPGAVLGTIAFYDYRFDRVTTNKLLFAGRLSALAGQSFALVQTPYTVVSGLIKNDKLRKAGKLPEQMLEERLKNLDHLEEQILAK
ncbi:hypothetical protein KBI23_01030 [bacterium]|nr:hypothetical protein [bacterium]MBP9808910.1 hypothetical protein [bacterium]